MSYGSHQEVLKKNTKHTTSPNDTRSPILNLNLDKIATRFQNSNYHAKKKNVWIKMRKGLNF